MALPENNAKELLRGLMMSENLGDVHDQINRLHRLLGMPEPKGNFLDGWTDDDLRRAGFDA
jgi:hypothetical protein